MGAVFHDASAAVFRVIGLGYPSGTISQAIDLNENGTLLGEIQHGTNLVFLWKDGKVRYIDSPGDAVWAEALNNSDQVVGGYSQIITNETGLRESVTRAWEYAGTNSLIGETFGLQSAYGINDFGDIVCNLHNQPYLLNGSRLRLSLGDVTDLTIPAEARKINNEGTVIGTINDRGVRWRRENAYQPVYLSNSRGGSSINADGTIAGAGHDRLSGTQAALWTRTNVMWLGVALSGTSMAADISDSGVIVGQYYEPQVEHIAMLWTNGVGLDLNSIADIPSGMHLESAVAANNNGWIAANSTSGAVLLVPQAELAAIPMVAFLSSSAGIQVSNFVRCELDLAAWPAPIKRVHYSVYKRWLEPVYEGNPLAGEKMRITARLWRSSLLLTNEANQSPFQAVFTNLPAAQYAISATILDSKGVRAFPQAMFFTVTGSTSLQAIRTTLRGDFEFGFDGSIGAKYVVEESTNLLNWSAIPKTSGTLGGTLTYPGHPGPAKFFRNRVVENDPELFGEPILWPEIPTSLSGRSLSLYIPIDGTIYHVSFMENALLLVKGVDYENPRVGTYRFELKHGLGQLHLKTDPYPSEFHLELEWSFGPVPNEFEGYEIRNGVRFDLRGQFSIFPP
jgi:uncharacterized membrane protein